MDIDLKDKFEALNCPKAGAILTVTDIRFYQGQKLITVIGDGCAWHNAPAAAFENKEYWRKL